MRLLSDAKPQAASAYNTDSGRTALLPVPVGLAPEDVAVDVCELEELLEELGELGELEVAAGGVPAGLTVKVLPVA